MTTSSLFQRRMAWLVLVVAVVLSPLIVWQVRAALRSNSNDVRDWLPAEYPETADYRAFHSRFGSEDFVAASWPGCTLDDPRLAKFAERLRAPERATLFRSIYTGKELVQQLGETPISLSREIAIGRLKGALVGPDGKATCAVVTLTDVGRRDLQAMLSVVSAAAAEAGIAATDLKLGGPPVVNAAMNRESSQSLVRLAMLAMAIGLVIAWRCFHAIRLTLMVFAIGLLSATASLAIVRLCGVPLNAILITMAPLVYVSAMSGAIHLTNYYLDAVEEGISNPVRHAINHAMLPLALAAGTTAIGLLSLEFADLSPIRQFGRFSAIGIVVSVVVQFTLLPACLTLWPPPARRGPGLREVQDDVLEPEPLHEPPPDTWFGWFSSGVVRERHWLVALFLVLLAVGAFGLSRVETSIQIIRLFSPGTPILAHYSFLEQHLGGLVPMEVILRFDKTNQQSTASRLKLVQAIQKDLNGLPAVTGNLSAATFAPEPVPAVRRLAYWILLRRQMVKSGYVVDEVEAEFWRISVRVRAEGDLDYDRFQELLRKKIDPHLAAVKDDGGAAITATYTGTVPIIYKARRSLLNGMILGFGTDVLLIVIAAVFVTRHWSNGVLLLLACVFPMLIVFGWMGLTGIVVDIGSVMTPCVALGVTVDDVIHFILWFRRGIAQGRSVRGAVHLAYDGCARAMYQSWGVIGLGLSAFALSTFVPTFRFGALMIALLNRRPHRQSRLPAGTARRPARPCDCPCGSAGEADQAGPQSQRTNASRVDPHNEPLALGAAARALQTAGMLVAEPLPQIKPLFIGPIRIDPPILQAPMAGFTNYAFRQIVRQYGGAGLLATEMVAARSFVWLDEHAESPDRLWGVKDEPRPLAVQMWDNDPATLAKVGERLAREYQVSVVDINFGCPVRDVTEKAHSGSYLLKFPERIRAIVSRVVEACRPTPVTAKIRLGCSRDKITGIEVAQAVEDAGAAALTVHGRVAADFFKGTADWERIAEIKQHLKRMPLIGNGDLDSAEKVVEAFRRYGVDGVMIARASLGRPWLFAQAAAALRGEPLCRPIRPSTSSGASCFGTTTCAASGSASRREPC